MSKLRKNQPVNKITDSTGAKTNISQPGKNSVGYKISCKEFKKKFALLGESDDWNESGLIGFNFYMNEEVEGDAVNLGYLKVNDVIYKNGTDGEPRLENGSASLSIGLIGSKYLVEIDETVEGEFELTSPRIQEGLLSDRLDYYDLKTHLAYFTVDQLRILLDNFTYLVISGCTVEYGKIIKKYDESPKEGEKFFTLKIEALNEKDSKGKELKDEEADAPLMVVGHPCPPIWQSLTAAMSEARKTPAGKAQPNYFIAHKAELEMQWKVMAAQLQAITTGET